MPARFAADAIYEAVDAGIGTVICITEHVPVHEMLRTHPLGRLGVPEDVARVALFLASDEAGYLNAVDIVVDGGQSVIS